MRPPRLLLLPLAAAALAACGNAAASSDLLIVTPDPRVTAQPVSDPKYADCKPVVPATATESDMVFDGPCSFQFLGRAKCIEKTDDFYANIQLKLQDGGTLNFNVNLEHYKGAGDYTNSSQAFMQTTHNGLIAIWLDNSASAVLSGDKKTLTIRPDAMPGAPGTVNGGVETMRGVMACG